MQNIILKYEELPYQILGFYTKVLNNDYIILNSTHSIGKTFFAANACLYYKENNFNAGKIELSDLQRNDFKPILYAKDKLKSHLRIESNVC